DRGRGARLLESLSCAYGTLNFAPRPTGMNFELQFAVQDLNARYIQAIDDNKLELWPDFFLENGRYRVTTAENFDRGLPLAMIYAPWGAVRGDGVRSRGAANV